MSQAQLAELVPDDSTNAYEQKILSNFVENGRLTQIPARYKKQFVIMKWVANHFQPGVRYPEADLNDILKPLHSDYASLRRFLIEHKLMTRENNIYWRI